MNNPYDEMEKASYTEREAYQKRLNAERAVQELEKKVKDTLSVGANIPQKVGLLPDGSVIVVQHHKVKSSTNPNYTSVTRHQPFHLDFNGNLKDR